jgi:two-component system sensor histidine kinase KdpD
MPLGYLAAGAGTALVTLLIGLWSPHPPASISMLYLLAVLGTATVFGRGPAVAAAVLAVLAFNFFFVDPVHTFVVDDPNEWFNLLLLLATAIVTGSLAAELRRRADEAHQREREALALYALAQLIEAENDPGEALPAVAERLRAELAAGGVSIAVADDGDHLAERARAGKMTTTDGRAVAGRAAADEKPDTIVTVPLRAGDRTVGALRIARPPVAQTLAREEERLLAAAAAQIGLVLDRARLRAEATQAEVLRRSDDLKTALLNSVSHDLRTPLASIKAAADSLLEADVEWSQPEWRSFATTIESQVTRLNRIVSNLLDVSRIEAGTLRPRKELYPLPVLVGDVIGRLGAAADRARVAVHLPDDLPAVPLDYVEIDQVLTNLIDNALKHTPAGTPIAVRAEVDGHAVRVTVTDEGPGIPPAARPRVFDKFYRGDPGGGARPPGTGLGLTVARGLVEAHGGRIWVESEPHQGTSFHFTLPLEPSAVDASG